MFPLFKSVVNDTTCDLHWRYCKYSSFSFEPIINSVNQYHCSACKEIADIVLVQNESEIIKNYRPDYTFIFHINHTNEGRKRAFSNYCCNSF